MLSLHVKESTYLSDKNIRLEKVDILNERFTYIIKLLILKRNKLILCSQVKII